MSSPGTRWMVGGSTAQVVVEPSPRNSMPAIALGLGSSALIARLTRPRMRLRFSESAVVAPYRGGRGLMFRMVNQQPSELSDVQVRVSATSSCTGCAPLVPSSQ